MKRFLIGLVLIIFISAMLVFIMGRLLAQGSDTNIFNAHYRATVARYPFARSIFALHETGDAKSDYLGPRYPNIQIEVDSMAGFSPQPEVLYQLAELIKGVTGKPVTINFSNEDIPARPLSATTDIDQVINAYRNNHSGGNTAVVYLLVLNVPPGDPTLLGMTHHEDEIILFTKALQDFTADSPSTFANYELSTALHEFGHLLGLPHNEQAGCLMNAQAETDHVPRFNAADVVTDFCGYEKQLIGAKQ